MVQGTREVMLRLCGTSFTTAPEGRTALPAFSFRPKKDFISPEFFTCLAGP